MRRCHVTVQAPFQPPALNLTTPVHCQETITTSNMLGYLAALPLLYIFVYLPISNSYFGDSQWPLGQHVAILNNSLIADDVPLSCPSHDYNTFILSQEPLVIYIENFFGAVESKHLIDIR